MTGFDKELIQKVADELRKKKHTIATAESVTAGLLQAALASAEYASEIFQGGITTYNINQKYRHLHIDLNHAIGCNCVSEQIAGEMALAVTKLFDCDWGIAITGYAAPIPEAKLEDLYACFAVAFRDKIVLTKTVRACKEKAEDVQIEYVNMVLREMLGAGRRSQV